jgi:hypothetical protein
MSNNRNSSQWISRRVMLTELALGAAAVTTVTRASAQQKVSQADAKYQREPKGQQRCDNCINFQPPNACKLVEGDVISTGWCQLYAPKT